MLVQAIVGMAAADGRRIRAAGGIDDTIFNGNRARVVPQITADASGKLATCYVQCTRTLDGQGRTSRHKDASPLRAALQSVFTRKCEV